MKTAIEIIQDEIDRQITIYGYTDYHIQNSPEDYDKGQLADAASCYAMTIDPHSISDDLFPWPDEYWKPSPENRVKELAKAGAMIIREINRLNNSEYVSAQQQPVSKSEERETDGEVDLKQLHDNLRKLLFVRPFDINAIETSGVKLCDAVFDILDDGDE